MSSVIELIDEQCFSGGFIMSYLSIKGTMKGLIICIEGNTLFENIKSELISRLEASKGFFKEAPFCLYGDQNLPSEQRQALIDLCVDNGMVLDNSIVSAMPKQYSPNNKNTDSQPVTDDNLVINRNIRSGQRIIAKKDLVIVGNVNPGAELIAGGNIIVMGSLRGVAHAGSTGNEFATITAQEMQPTQIRIAGIVACKPDHDTEAPAQTEIAYIKDNKIVIEAFNNTNNIFRGSSRIA
jgi:septum site-determining protein MinC